MRRRSKCEETAEKIAIAPLLKNAYKNACGTLKTRVVDEVRVRPTVLTSMVSGAPSNYVDVDNVSTDANTDAVADAVEPNLRAVAHYALQFPDHRLVCTRDRAQRSTALGEWQMPPT